MLQEPTPFPDLASAYRELYRARFRAGVQAGTTKPFVIPLCLVAYYVVPTLYLAIPHKNRPWLYHARWLVIAFVCAFDWYMVKNVASVNFASSYGAGLLAAWATIWNFTLLVWTRPQWEARRVERRRVLRPSHHRGDSQRRSQPPISTSQRSPSKSHTEEPNGSVSALTGTHNIALESSIDGAANAAKTTAADDKVHGARKRGIPAEQPAAIPESIVGVEEQDSEEKLLARNIVALNENSDNDDSRLDQKTALRLSRLARDNEYEYYWQEYPADASFWTRLGWAFDIVSSLRLTGKYNAPIITKLDLLRLIIRLELGAFLSASIRGAS